MLARHLALRYLRRRRSAWLAMAAVAMTVLVPVVVMGILQGWVDVVSAQVRGAESDLVVGRRGWLLPARSELVTRIEAVPGVAAVSRIIDTEAMLVPIDQERNPDGHLNQGVLVAGVDLDGEKNLQRFDASRLHAPPVEDLDAPALTPEQRGSGVLTQDARAYLVHASSELLAGISGLPLPPPPRASIPFRSGVVLGREIIYASGGPEFSPFAIGKTVSLVRPDGSGGLIGRVTAQVSDTLGTGIYEIDRGSVLLDVYAAQQLTDMDGRNPRHNGPSIDGWRIRLHAGADPATVSRAVADSLGLPVSSVRTWREVRGSLLDNLEVQRSVGLVTMIFIQALCVFIVYAVFSTLVSEKRHDIGVLIGLGAPRKAIRRAFLLAGMVACIGGGLAGWAGGWVTMLVLDPILAFFGISLFPETVVFIPGTPLSFSPQWPLVFLGLSATIGLLASALPAWRASRVDPLQSIREAA